MRTSDGPANPKPPPDDRPCTPGVPPCGGVLAKLSWREPSPSLNQAGASPILARPCPPHAHSPVSVGHGPSCYPYFSFVHLPRPDPASPFSFPFEEMSLDKERMGGFSPRWAKGLTCKRCCRKAVVFSPPPGQRISEGCLSRQMPPRAPNPCALALSVDELGLAAFWKMTVFLAGREWAGLLAPLWFSQEVGLPLAPGSHPAPSPSVSQTRAAPALKESEERERPRMGRALKPVAEYLKQKETGRLVPGELCSPQERRKGLGLDFLPPHR